MDWDKLKVFHVAAEAGSFTHAGETLGLSQSAVSRQVSALETDLKVPLFHRHARGLILTEQGELLYRTAHDVFLKLEAARAQLTDSREKPNGELRVTTAMGLGTHWLTARVGEFSEMFPDIRIQLILTDDELDLAMREADVAIRMRQPVQPDLGAAQAFHGELSRICLGGIYQAPWPATHAGGAGSAPDCSAGGADSSFLSGAELARVCRPPLWPGAHPCL